MSKARPTMCISSTNEGKTQVKWVVKVREKVLENELMQTTFPKDPPIVSQT